MPGFEPISGFEIFLILGKIKGSKQVWFVNQKNMFDFGGEFFFGFGRKNKSVRFWKKIICHEHREMQGPTST
jgi:hypothetical protein